MDEMAKSPLVRNKPGWYVRYMRFMWFLVTYGALAFGLTMLLSWVFPKPAKSFEYFIASGFVLFLLGYVVWWIWLVSWVHSYGVRLRSWKKHGPLHRIDGVPCPNCLYSLCSVEEAGGEKLCSECGCCIDGHVAMRAWKKVLKKRIPPGWNAYLDRED